MDMLTRIIEMERMKEIAIIAVFLLPSLAMAADDGFGSRVQRARLIEETSGGQAYQKELWASLGDQAATAMQECFPRGVEADTAAFILVGDVDGQSHLQDVEVRPSTAMSRCFAEKFASLRFPEPPEGVMPLVIEMKIKP